MSKLRLLLFTGMVISAASIIGLLTSPIDVRNSWHEESLAIGWCGVAMAVVALLGIAIARGRRGPGSHT